MSSTLATSSIVTSKTKGKGKALQIEQRSIEKLSDIVACSKDLPENTRYRTMVEIGIYSFTDAILYGQQAGLGQEAILHYLNQPETKNHWKKKYTELNDTISKKYSTTIEQLARKKIFSPSVCNLPTEFEDAIKSFYTDVIRQRKIEHAERPVAASNELPCCRQLTKHIPLLDITSELRKACKQFVAKLAHPISIELSDLMRDIADGKDVVFERAKKIFQDYRSELPEEDFNIQAKPIHGVIPFIKTLSRQEIIDELKTSISERTACKPSEVKLTGDVGEKEIDVSALQNPGKSIMLGIGITYKEPILKEEIVGDTHYFILDKEPHIVKQRKLNSKTVSNYHVGEPGDTLRISNEFGKLVLDQKLDLNGTRTMLPIKIDDHELSTTTLVANGRTYKVIPRSCYLSSDAPNVPEIISYRTNGRLDKQLITIDGEVIPGSTPGQYKLDFLKTGSGEAVTLYNSSEPKQIEVRSKDGNINQKIAYKPQDKLNLIGYHRGKFVWNTLEKNKDFLSIGDGGTELFKGQHPYLWGFYDDFAIVKYHPDGDINGRPTLAAVNLETLEIQDIVHGETSNIHATEDIFCFSVTNQNGKREYFAEVKTETRMGKKRLVASQPTCLEQASKLNFLGVRGNKPVVCFIDKESSMPFLLWHDLVELDPTGGIGQYDPWKFIHLNLDIHSRDDFAMKTDSLVSFPIRAKEVASNITTREAALIELYNALETNDGPKFFATYQAHFDPKDKSRYIPQILAAINADPGKFIDQLQVKVERQTKKEVEALAKYLVQPGFRFSDISLSNLRFGFSKQVDLSSDQGKKAKLRTGNPSDRSEKRQVALRFNRNFRGMATKHIYSGYDPVQDEFRKVRMPEQDIDPTSTYQVKAQIDGDGIACRAANGSVTNVKAIGRSGAKAMLTRNNFGEPIISVNPVDRPVKVEYTVNTYEPKIEELRQSELEEFNKSFLGQIRLSDRDLLTAPVPLPRQKIFQDVIALAWTMPPLERIELIQNFVGQITYYDHDNEDVAEVKDELRVRELYVKMEERMETIRAVHPGKYDQKLLAGVCRERAILLASLLRECGFLAELQTGFNVNGKKATLNQEHANVTIPLPLGDSYQRIEVDVQESSESSVNVLELFLDIPNLDPKDKENQKPKEATKQKAKELASEVREAIKQESGSEVESSLQFEKITEPEKIAFLEAVFDYALYAGAKDEFLATGNINLDIFFAFSGNTASRGSENFENLGDLLREYAQHFGEGESSHDGLRHIEKLLIQLRENPESEEFISKAELNYAIAGIHQITK